MKKLFFIIFFTIALIENLPCLADTTKPPLIIIDPGHGGIDPGAVYASLKEKEINLKVAKYLKQILDKKGVIVALTREDDRDLASLYPGSGTRHFRDVLNRRLYIDNFRPDFFVSIHVNSQNPRKQNYAKVFYGRNSKSLPIANVIQENLNTLYSNFKSPEMADFLVLSATTPGVLVEIGFIDDAKIADEQFLRKLSQTLAQGIQKALTTKPREVAKEAKVLLIIDDFGNYNNDWKYFLTLDFPFTAAIMPFLENTKDVINSMIKANKDIIIHLPMEPKKYKRSWLGPEPIMINLEENTINEILIKTLKENPYALGINNHTGSKACETEKVVRTILRFCQKHNLVYIDSQTTPNSLFPILGSEYGVVVYKRDIFLEVNGKNEKAIIKQILLLEKIAKEKGLAIAIGHVGFEGGLPTLNALKAAYPPLQAKGIKFCSLKDIVKKHP